MPYGTPQYGEWAAGQVREDSGRDRVAQGLGAAAISAATAIPVISQVGILAGGYAAWTGADMAAEGTAMKAHAQSLYEADYARQNEVNSTFDYESYPHGPTTSIAPNMSMEDGSFGYNGASLGGDLGGYSASTYNF